MLACLYLKITIFPLNHHTNSNDLAIYAKEIKSKFVFTDKKFSKIKTLNNIGFQSVQKLSKKEYLKVLNKKKIFDKSKSFDYIVSLSSGTTGKSKKIVLTDDCKFKRAEHTINYYNLGNEIKTIICTPLYHSLAQRLFFISIISGGYSVILKKFTLEKWYKYVKKYQVSFSMPISTQIRQFINSKEYNFKSLKSLKTIISTSDSIAKSEKIKLTRKFNCKLHEIYGTSEMATISNLNIIKDKLKLGSVGRLLDDTVVKIKHKKNGIGEIYCKNARAFKGYFGKKNKNSFFSTGDLGYFDRDGFLYFSGRNKDVIKISGMNVLPVEIEKKISKCKYVKECAVIGEPNFYFGEIIKAIIVPKNFREKDESNIKKYLFNQLNEYEKPQKIEFQDALPRNEIGKIDKKKIKEINNLKIKKAKSQKKFII